MILVPSAGRCGSSYFAKVLQASGLDCPNGSIGKDGGVGWEITPIIRTLNLSEGDVIIHQRRDVLTQISSMQAFSPLMWDRAKELGAYVTGDVIQDAWQFWLDWTKQCEMLTLKEFYIEDLANPEQREQIEQWCGRPLQWDAVKSTFNKREYRMLSWKEVLKGVSDGRRMAN